jgi:hypothetical protein
MNLKLFRVIRRQASSGPGGTFNKGATTVMEKKSKTQGSTAKKDKDTVQPSELDPVQRVNIVNDKIDISGGEEGERRLMQAVGSNSRAFMHGILVQLAAAGSEDKKPNNDRLKLMLSIVIAIKPQDQIEALLAVQMATTHVMAMRFANYIVSSDSIIQQDSGERILNKLLRTFPMQMEALYRYRMLEAHRIGARHESVEEKVETPLQITDARAVPMDPLEQREAIAQAASPKLD